MNYKEIIIYWEKSAKQDYKIFNHLYKKRDYTWCLFIGHLIIEKLLKALYVKKFKKEAPYTHNLLILIDKISLSLDENKFAIFTEINTFNIESRYPDYKLQFYKKCNKKFSNYYYKQIKEFYKWLKKMI